MSMVRVGMAPRLPRHSPEAFQTHWRTDHADAAGAIAGVRRYVQHHAVLVDGRPVLPYPGFDACAELGFDDLAAHDRAFGSAQYQGEVRADEDRFIDKSRFSMVLADRRTAVERQSLADPVTLMVLWRVHPASTLVDLRAAWQDWARIVAGDRGVRGHDELVVRHDWHEGRQPPACDHIDVLWFDGPDAALAHLAGPAHDAALTMAGTTFGMTGHLARPHHVVG